MYIVDTRTKNGNTSNEIYSDSLFGGSSDESAGPLFCYINADGLQKNVVDTTKLLYSTSFNDTTNTMKTAISNAMVYVRDL